MSKGSDSNGKSNFDNQKSNNKPSEEQTKRIEELLKMESTLGESKHITKVTMSSFAD